MSCLMAGASRAEAEQEARWNELQEDGLGRRRGSKARKVNQEIATIEVVVTNFKIGREVGEQGCRVVLVLARFEWLFFWWLSGRRCRHRCKAQARPPANPHLPCQGRPKSILTSRHRSNSLGGEHSLHCIVETLACWWMRVC